MLSIMEKASDSDLPDLFLRTAKRIRHAQLADLAPSASPQVRAVPCASWTGPANPCACPPSPNASA